MIPEGIATDRATAARQKTNILANGYAARLRAIGTGRSAEDVRNRATATAVAFRALEATFGSEVDLVIVP